MLLAVMDAEYWFWREFARPFEALFKGGFVRVVAFGLALMAALVILMALANGLNDAFGKENKGP